MVAEEKTQDDEEARYSGPPILEGYISEQEYARQRGVSLRTCQRDRALRKSPPHCVLGKQVFYRIVAVRAWLLEQERSFEPGRPRRPGARRGG
jgi:hypothetical protein